MIMKINVQYHFGLISQRSILEKINFETIRTLPQNNQKKSKMNIRFLGVDPDRMSMD
jgi:hypothetical protein